MAVPVGVGQGSGNPEMPVKGHKPSVTRDGRGVGSGGLTRSSVTRLIKLYPIREIC